MESSNKRQVKDNFEEAIESDEKDAKRTKINQDITEFNDAICSGDFIKALSKYFDDLRAELWTPDEIGQQAKNIAEREAQKKLIQLICPQGCFKEAAKFDNVELLKWMKTQGMDYKSEKAMQVALRYGSLDTAKWLLAEGIQLSKHDSRMVAESDNIEALEWVLSNGIQWSVGFSRVAAENRNQKMLEWIFCEKKSLDSNLMFYAIKTRDIGFLKFLHSNGVKIKNKDIVEAREMFCSNEIINWLKHNKNH